MKNMNFTLYLTLIMGLGLGLLQPAFPARAEMEKHHGNGPKLSSEERGHGSDNRGMMDRLRKNDPERFKQLMNLRKEDSEAFRSALREEARKLCRRDRKKNTRHHREIMKLVQQYHKTETGTEKDELKEEIRKSLEKSFERRLQRYEKKLEELSERLQRMREKMDARKKNRDQLIERQLDFLTDPERFDSKQ